MDTWSIKMQQWICITFWNKCGAFFATHLWITWLIADGSCKSTNTHSERNVRPRCKVSGCEFSTKSDIAVLIRTGTAPGDIHVAGRLSQTSCLLHPDFDKCAPHIENQWGFIDKNWWLRPAYQRSVGLYLQKLMITPRISKINGALLKKIDDCAPHIKDQRGFIDQKLWLRPTYQRLTGLYWLNMMITPHISKINGALLTKHDDYAPRIKERPGLVCKSRSLYSICGNHSQWAVSYSIYWIFRVNFPAKHNPWRSNSENIQSAWQWVRGPLRSGAGCR